MDTLGPAALSAGDGPVPLTAAFLASLHARRLLVSLAAARLLLAAYSRQASLPPSLRSLLAMPLDPLPSAPLPGSLPGSLTGSSLPLDSPPLLISAAHARLLARLADREARLARVALLARIDSAVGLPPSASAAVASLLAWLAVQRTVRRYPHVVSTLVGVLFPVYASLRAVEAPRPDDDERWLTYWSVFGLVSLLDHGASWIQARLSVYYVPKMALLYWLYGRDGSLTVYRSVVRPALAHIRDRLRRANMGGPSLGGGPVGGGLGSSTSGSSSHSNSNSNYNSNYNSIYYNNHNNSSSSGNANHSQAHAAYGQAPRPSTASASSVSSVSTIIPPQSQSYTLPPMASTHQMPTVSVP